MRHSAAICRLARAASVIAALIALSACSALQRAPEPTLPTVNRPAEPAKPPPPAKKPVPAPARSVQPAPPPAPRDVIVLFESDTPEYAEVAEQLAAALPASRYRVLLTDIEGPAGAGRLAALSDRAGSIVVAVGRDAVDGARSHLHATPIVFCQVFNYEDLRGDSLWGVQPLPPLSLQLRAWQTVDPLLKRVGLIVSEEHADVVATAQVEAMHAGVQIEAEISGSDRETLYLFKRLAAEVDGFWLFPDNRILSTGVLRELLRYAQIHNVGVLVSSKTLLSWGALLSATSRPADVAALVRGIVSRIAAGDTRGLPRMTPLSAVELQLNPSVAARLGASNLSPEPWVLREHD